MNMGDTATHEHADMAWSTNQQTWVWYVGEGGSRVQACSNQMPQEMVQRQRLASQGVI